MERSGGEVVQGRARPPEPDPRIGPELAADQLEALILGSILDPDHQVMDPIPKNPFDHRKHLVDGNVPRLGGYHELGHGEGASR